MCYWRMAVRTAATAGNGLVRVHALAGLLAVDAVRHELDDTAIWVEPVTIL